MKIYNAKIYTMDIGIIENGWIEINNGKICSVNSGTPDSIC